jgi:nitroreductase
MNVLEALAARRSVRDFAATPVARETVEQLLAVAVQAPSAMNAQNWAFGVVQGTDRLAELGARARVVFAAMLDAQGVTGPFRDAVASPDFAPFYNAGTLVVIYAIPGPPLGSINCALAAENLMLAAVELGLGTCWIGIAGPFLEDADVKRELGVPADYEAVAALIVGYPAGDNPAPSKNEPQVLYWL